MNLARDDRWSPSPQLLAAYADGELQGTPEFDDLHRRIEFWLTEHPQEAAELESQRELSRLMSETRPPVPAPAIWAIVWARVLRGRPAAIKRRLVGWSVELAVAAAILLIAIGISTYGPSSRGKSKLTNALGQPTNLATAQAAAEVLETFELVTADDIEIVHVAGPDAGTLIIGRVPLAESMTLLKLHEMAVSLPTDAEPKTELRTCGSSTPLVWTPLPAECKNGK